MIIADVTSFFSAACGGIKTYYRAKAEWMPRRGATCHFVVPGRRHSATRFGAGTLHTVAGVPWCRHYRLFGDIGRLYRVLDAIGPDIIELGSHYVLPDIIAHALSRLRSRPRLVGFYHADFPSTYVAPMLPGLPRVQELAMRCAWRLVRRHHRRYAMTLVGSHHIAGRLAGQRVPRVRWVGLGVDTGQFRPQPVESDGLTVAYFGRLAREKECSLLVQAFDAVHAAVGARLVVAGDGPLMPRLRDYAAPRPHVTVLGYVDDPARLARLMASADVVVATGAHESFSLTAAEALACGTPVVGADRGGNAELIERSRGGLTFASGDAADLAARLIELCEAPAETRAHLGANGRRYVLATHTWEQVMARIHAAYEEVLACSR